MKKILALTTFASLLLTFNAHAENRFGVQASANGSAGVLYYIDDYKYAIGTQFQRNSDNNALGKTSTNDVSLFARAGQKIHDKTYVYGGLLYTQSFGQTNGIDINKEYSIAPYALVDYHLTDHVFINGYIFPVTYKHVNLEGAESYTTYKYPSAGIGVSYMF